MSKHTDEPTAEKVFKMFDGGKTTPATDVIPSNVYEITDTDGTTHTIEGFLIFTSQHIAVMRDEGSGSIPVLVMPLTSLKVAVLSDEVDAV